MIKSTLLINNNSMAYSNTPIQFNLVKLISRLAVSLLVVLSVACSSFEPRLKHAEQDFCSTINQIPQQALSNYLLPFQQQMKTSTGAYILEQATEALHARAWLSDHAEYSIDVQYFIFSTDNVGLIAIDYLVKAAERGIRVRILVDDITVQARGSELLKLAAHDNISIKIYNPRINIGQNIIEKTVNLTLGFHQLNQRMHNKTFTVDGKVSITGGRNIADEYFGYDSEFNFRDRDVLLLGRAVNDIQSSFNQFWQYSLSIPVEELVYSRKKPSTNYDALHQYACNPAHFSPQVRAAINNIPNAFRLVPSTQPLHWIKDIEYVSDIPGKNDGKTFLGGSGLSTQRLISLVEKAQKSVTIQTPYLITTQLAKNLFKTLVDKGVEVKILTNSLISTDNLEAFSGYQRDRRALLKTGVKIYEFKPDARIRQKIMADTMGEELQNIPVFGLHAKSLVIDDEITVIGTFNLDPRSANLNTESIAIIPSKDISLRVKQGMLKEMQTENAWQTTLDWNPDSQVSVLKQLRIKLRRIVPKNVL